MECKHKTGGGEAEDRLDVWWVYSVWRYIAVYSGDLAVSSSMYMIIVLYHIWANTFYFSCVWDDTVVAMEWEYVRRGDIMSEFGKVKLSCYCYVYEVLRISVWYGVIEAYGYL